MLLPLQQNMLLGTPPTLVTVPDVVGQTQAAGTATLQGLLFVVAVATAYSSVVAAGTIISQSPIGGVEAVEGSTVTITVSLGEAPVAPSNATGGFFFDYDSVRSERNRRRRELEERKRAQEAEEALKADAQAKEIAQLLLAQEAKDAEREDLSRIQSLADGYANASAEAATGTSLPARTRAALYNAHEQRTRNALEQARRELERMLDEEEAVIVMALLLHDD